MAALRAMAPSFACILLALATVWLGAWLMPPFGHWALFPTSVTVSAFFGVFVMAAIWLWPSLRSSGGAR